MQGEASNEPGASALGLSDCLEIERRHYRLPILRDRSKTRLSGFPN